MPTWHWLLITIVLAFGFLFTFGLVLITNFVTSLLPHMKYIWPLIGRFWFYVTGVFFSIDRFDSLPAVKTVMEVNPAYVYLSMSRDLCLPDRAIMGHMGVHGRLGVPVRRAGLYSLLDTGGSIWRNKLNL